MAKVIYMNGILSGKLGGLVYAFNKAGNYVRTFRKPTQPNTVAQLENRALFTQATTGWHALADTTKGLWNQFAITFFKSKFNPPGVAHSGFTAFVSLNNQVLNGQVKGKDPTISQPLGATADGLPFIVNDLPPTNQLSAQILDDVGAPLSFTVNAVDVVTTGGKCGITLNFGRIIGTGPTPDPPEFKDAIGNVPVGFAVILSKPLSQAEQYVENPDIALCTLIKPLDEITDWAARDNITIAGEFCPEFYTRKLQYRAGDIVQAKVYMVGQNGMTQPVGAAITTITA